MTTKTEYRSFEKAREFIRSQNLKSRREWDRYRKSGKMPDDIPQNPGKEYKEQWQGLDDWLGIELEETDFLSYEEAKKIVHRLNLENEEEWNRYRKSGRLPDIIPMNPRKTYKREWKGMGDWLGTNVIAHQKKRFRDYEEAKEYVHPLGLESQPEWYRYCKSGKKPDDIPTHPDRTYKNKGWDPMKGYGDWLGTENVSTQAKGLSIVKVKELLRALIEPPSIIYTFSDARLISILNSRGLLKLHSGNPHNQFFKDLVEARKTSGGSKAIEEYAYSNSRNPPELSNGVEAEPANSIDAFGNYAKIRSPEQIMKEAEVVGFIYETGKYALSVDDEKMRFQVDSSVKELWDNAYKDEFNTVNLVKTKGLIGNKFHDLVNETFLSEYDAVQKIYGNLPEGYAFPAKPSLMQLLTAHKIDTLSYSFNFSRTGSGKTLSAILASRLIDSKMTIIVCPNDVVDQWKDVIIKAFRDSVVTKGKAAFNVIRDERKHQYLVLNYDKFSQDYSDNLILTLVEQKIDFLVLDEIHFVKQRGDVNESLRHRRIAGLRRSIKVKNENVKVLAMSATPVINDLTEGKSLLEILTGKRYDDVETRSNIQNAVNLHEKFSLLCVREKREYANVKTQFIEVEAPRPTCAEIKDLIRIPLLIENLLTEARIPEIISHIDGQTIIYTEYVTDIVKKLETAVEHEGYSHTLFTGEMKDLKPFKERRVQVLIASRPISVGVDELQYVCNRIIFNTLSWTHAQHEQTIGRLARNGQDKDIDIFIIKASIGGFPYDDWKWRKKIQEKRKLADCVVDGYLPTIGSVNRSTLEQETEAAIREWLDRLNDGKVSIVNRRDLVVELMPVVNHNMLLINEISEFSDRQRQISEFSRLNNIFNNSKSDTIHKKIQQEPQFLVDYLNKQDEVKRQWDFDPLDVIASIIRGGLELPAHLIKELVIGDFGCGRAKLSELLKENKMYNFDHHNIVNNKIIVCDMKSVPLKKDGRLDVAVFCLSLMEENWPEYIVEAKRCLAQHGFLLIVETTRSLSGRLRELRDIIKVQGFEKKSDEEKGDFTFIKARKL
jgi:superfamily II DNA or RNA helicase